PGEARCRTRPQLPAGTEIREGRQPHRGRPIAATLPYPAGATRVLLRGRAKASAPHDSLSMAQIDDFVSDPDGLRLIEAFMRIDNVPLRLRIVMLVQEIAGDDD